jgi:hypothetical protein
MMTLEEVITQIQESRAESPRVGGYIQQIEVKDLNKKYVLIDGEFEEVDED